jgi:hypothetical protein
VADCPNDAELPKAATLVAPLPKAEGLPKPDDCPRFPKVLCVLFAPTLPKELKDAPPPDPTAWGCPNAEDPNGAVLPLRELPNVVGFATALCEEEASPAVLLASVLPPPCKAFN